jgi:hypothetical protein
MYLLMTQYEIYYQKTISIMQISDLPSLCNELIKLCQQKLGLEHIEIIGKYKNMNYVTYNIKYLDSQLVIYNSIDVIRISSICPDLYIFTCQPNIPKVINKSNNHPKVSNKPISNPKVSNKPNDFSPFDDILKLSGPVESKQTKQIRPIESKIPVVKTDTIETYKTNKKIYKDIKNKLDETDVHPIFLVNYQIFKIMEAKKIISFEDDSNVDNEFIEYEQINDVVDQLLDEDVESIVYVPHNYHFMTQEEKKAHVDKYNISLEKFEKEYVYSNND